MQVQAEQVQALGAEDKASEQLFLAVWKAPARGGAMRSRLVPIHAYMLARGKGPRAWSFEDHGCADGILSLHAVLRPDPRETLCAPVHVQHRRVFSVTHDRDSLQEVESHGQCLWANPL